MMLSAFTGASTAASSLPYAHSHAMTRVKTTRTYTHFAWVLFSVLLVCLLGLVLIPWQQSVTGYGKVTIFSPMQRPQVIESQISGRVVEWFIQEGALVQKGQKLAMLQDIDPKFLDPQQVEKLKGQRQALAARKQAVTERLAAIERQGGLLENSRAVALPTQTERIGQARNRVIVSQQNVDAAAQALETAELNFRRVVQLEAEGLRSTRDKELVTLDQTRAKAAYESAQAQLAEARQALSIAQLDQTRLGTDLSAGISNVMASSASARESLAAMDAEIFKLDIELQNIASRKAQQSVVAPCDGRVVRLLPIGPGETVKAGDILATIVPETADVAVALYVNDNDAPLIAPGDPVRLQFAGWPAVQFTGWPFAMVGTFAGRVAVVDAMDDGNSNFRLLVKPDLEALKRHNDQPWPSLHKLRPGSKVAGWVLLKTVPLWFELWRQFNGFPPVVDPAKLKDSKGSSYEKASQAMGSYWAEDDDEKQKADIKRKVKAK
ncbi:MAG: HlyD family secretion protein [Vampirovibrionales bacterium]